MLPELFGKKFDQKLSPSLRKLVKNLPSLEKAKPSMEKVG